MRYGIFSDVHSNLEAFQAVYDYYKKQKIDKFIFLGDIIGYGADPRQVISLLKTLNPRCIAGNHDWALLDKFSIDRFNPQAKEAILWTKTELFPEQIRYLRTFELTHETDDFICVHGSLEEPHKFNYILDTTDAEINFPLLKKKICFVGHSHRREVFCLKEDRSSRLFTNTIKIRNDEKYIINVGSVGQPRDRDPRASLCVYDSDKNIVIFKRLDYNIKGAAAKILKAGLPSVLAERLYIGY
jgi:diadenosine tetraphosphatase ApaH/serine/threonine PP2A family protein phosphatase